MSGTPFNTNYEETKRLRIYRTRMIDNGAPVYVYTGLTRDIGVMFGPTVANRFGIPVGVIATALVLPLKGRSVLVSIEVTVDCQRAGLGMELLEYLFVKLGPMDGFFCSSGGIALAKSFEQRHGKQPWTIRPKAVEAPPPAVLLGGAN